MIYETEANLDLFVSTISVLGRVRHRFIIEDTSVENAKIVSRRLLKELKEITDEESQYVSIDVAIFGLDKDHYADVGGYFVCF